MSEDRAGTNAGNGGREEWWHGALMLGSPVLAAAVFVAAVAADHHLAGRRPGAPAGDVAQAAATVCLAAGFAGSAVGGFFYLAGAASLPKRAVLAFGCGVFGLVVCWIFAMCGVVATVGL